jgi:cytochrome c oxidase subunit II
MSSSAGPNRRHAYRIGALTTIGTAILLPIVIFVLGPNMPPGKSTDAAAGQVTDNTVLLVVMTPFTVFIIVYLVYAVFAFRAGVGEERTDGAPIKGHMPSQIVWLATTTAAVLFLAIFGSAELLADNGSGGGSGPNPITKPGGRPLQVQVIGQQWAFTYRWPSYGGVETAQLVLPVGVEIEFHVTSLDVIHSFWAYQLGVKADANPGVDNIAYVKATKTGTFRIQCAELCGLWHGYMFDTGKVVSTSQFTSWITSQRQAFSGSLKYLPPYALTYSPDPQARGG